MAEERQVIGSKTLEVSELNTEASSAWREVLTRLKPKLLSSLIQIQPENGKF